MVVRVLNPAGQMSLVGVGADAAVPVGQPVTAMVNTQGVSIKPSDLEATAKGRTDRCTRWIRRRTGVLSEQEEGQDSK